MFKRRMLIPIVAVAVWVGLTAAVAYSVPPATPQPLALQVTTSLSPTTSDSPTTSSTPSTSGAPTTSVTPSTSSAPTTSATPSTSSAPTTSVTPSTSVPSTSVVPNPGNRTVEVSAGPAGSITVAVTDMVLTLEEWNISGFEVVELEERGDRIEIELENGDVEVELKVRLKDSGELDIRLEVD